jgi:ribose/xylose/arabinose/galactoside ABC-type transport system permease subunit
MDISPILATLGTMIMISGFAVVLTEGYVISGLPETWRLIGNGAVLGIPIPILIFAACAGVMALLLNRTPFGKQVYLIGSNPTACTFSGVNNRKVLFYTYVISGIFSGIASMVMIFAFHFAKAVTVNPTCC